MFDSGVEVNVGGAAPFLGYLTGPLRERVVGAYRTSGDHGLAGHSGGAMFALYDTLTVRVRIDTVRMLGDQAWVYSTGEVNGRLQWVGRWVPVLSWQRELEVARRENGVWRLIGYQQ